MSKLQWIKDKILTQEQLSYKVNAWKLSGLQIVFTNGVFDLLHRGHLQYLAEAASLGNILIVGLNADSSVRRLKGPNRPIHSEKDRALQLASLLVVDAVILFEEDTPLELIKKIQPDILAKGGDYKVETIVGAQEIISKGGNVEVIRFEEGYSSTNIINHIKKL